MSRNPCCGPALDGVRTQSGIEELKLITRQVTALRSAFSFNMTLMRVFLNATGLNSEGAICLAEFLPEVKSLIHLDLTENFDVDIAGVLALSVAVKMNRTLRCLDLNILVRMMCLFSLLSDY
jgi:protein phosphatase 1 regulatory subunit 37